jgi:MFS family permease
MNNRIAHWRERLTRDNPSGWGNGFNTATTPLWVSELSPAKSRGRLVAMEGSLIALGIVIASYYNIGMAYTTGPVVWRAPIASQIIIVILQVAFVLVLPESPRWLTKRMLTLPECTFVDKAS